jgi:hypothetical protein
MLHASCPQPERVVGAARDEVLTRRVKQHRLHRILVASKLNLSGHTWGAAGQAPPAATAYRCTKPNNVRTVRLAVPWGWCNPVPHLQRAIQRAVCLDLAVVACHGQNLPTSVKARLVCRVFP